MPRPTSKNSDAAWAGLIREAITPGQKGRPAGDGWKSAEEFANEAGRSVSTARNTLRQLHKARKLEHTRGLIGRGWVNFYRPI